MFNLESTQGPQISKEGFFEKVNEFLIAHNENIEYGLRYHYFTNPTRFEDFDKRAKTNDLEFGFSDARSKIVQTLGNIPIPHSQKDLDDLTASELNVGNGHQASLLSVKKLPLES